VKIFFHCSALTVAGHQVLTKPLYHSPCSAEQGRENIMKGWWVKIRTGRDHSPNTVTGKTDLTQGS